jgi:hypothetical protein
MSYYMPEVVSITKSSGVQYMVTKVYDIHSQQIEATIFYRDIKLNFSEQQ